MMKTNPLVAFIVLLAVHSLVSFAAYRFLTTTTRRNLPVDSTPVDITTADQRARGETAFQVVTERQEVMIYVPWSVRLYVIFGYAALAAALVLAVIARFRGTTT
jgi:hypothetical protein